VAPGLIINKGAVSREVALALADGARGRLGADLGIGLTGIAGPGSDGSGLQPGTVFVALTTKEASFCRKPQLYFDRDRIRISGANHALDMIRRILTNLPVCCGLRTASGQWSVARMGTVALTPE